MIRKILCSIFTILLITNAQVAIASSCAEDISPFLSSLHTPKEEAHFAKIEARYQKKLKDGQAVKEKMARYRQVFQGCHAKGATAEHDVGKKAFTIFNVTMGMLIAGGMYMGVNYDKFETDDQMVNKSIYEAGSVITWDLMFSLIVSNPASSFWGKFAQFYAFDNVFTAGNSFAWNKFFGTQDELLEAKIEELRKNPDFKKRMQQLMTGLDNGHLYQKAKKMYREYVGALTTEGLNPEGMIPADLDNEEIKELVKEALALEVYNAGHDGRFKLGEQATDRYAFYSIAGVPFLLYYMVFGDLVYKTLCMGQVGPKEKSAAIVKAVIITIIGTLAFDAVNFSLRKEFLAQ